MSLRAFSLLLSLTVPDTHSVISTVERYVPFVPFGSWEGSWLVLARF